jgi:Fic family protein
MGIVPLERESGYYETHSAYSDKPYKTFIPKPLPPEPKVLIDSLLWDLLDRANRALGRLDGVSDLLPDPYLFTYFYVRKEAVLSSQIEGTQSTLSQLLLFETEQAPGVPLVDVKEVLNYVNALQYGISSITSANRPPISLRLIKEMHRILMTDARGGRKYPGEFRQDQNWIGADDINKATYIGPPPDKVVECLSELERFIHDIPERTPVLMKAALAHVQFETIHPFSDGNGRMGRLLITLLLCAESALQQPMLYLSLYFKANRNEYYERLQRVREHGDWEGWLRFFLQGILETSQQAVNAAQEILRLFDVDRKRISSLKQQANAPLRVHEILQKKPIVSIGTVAKSLGMSVPTVTNGIQRLEKMGILREVTGGQRNRLYMYQEYVDILNEGTNPFEGTNR